MYEVACFVVNDFQENTYLVWDETRQCLIIDPGCYSKEERFKIRTFIEQQGLVPSLLFNTHCHIDHVLGNRWFSDTYGLTLHLHEQELITYRETTRWAELFGMIAEEMPSELKFVEPGEFLSVGSNKYEVRFTPGHSVASLTLVNHEQKTIFSGDVLFNKSIGRTDLPGGNSQQLIESIQQQVMTLPNDYKVYSGHGPATTIGEERQFNPFLTAGKK